MLAICDTDCEGVGTEEGVGAEDRVIMGVVDALIEIVGFIVGEGAAETLGKGEELSEDVVLEDTLADADRVVASDSVSADVIDGTTVTVMNGVILFANDSLPIGDGVTALLGDSATVLL